MATVLVSSYITTTRLGDDHFTFEEGYYSYVFPNARKKNSQETKVRLFLYDK